MQPSAGAAAADLNTPAPWCCSALLCLLSPELWGGPRGHSQFFLVLGVSYFLLLEYHSSSGIPMEGRVITPKAAQSSWKKPFQVKTTMGSPSLLLKSCTAPLSWDGSHSPAQRCLSRPPMWTDCDPTLCVGLSTEQLQSPASRYSQNEGRTSCRTHAEPGFLPAQEHL